MPFRRFITPISIWVFALLCSISFLPPATARTISEQGSREVRAWSQDLSNAYVAENPTEIPAGMTPQSKLSKIRNEIFLWWARSKIRNNQEAVQGQMTNVLPNDLEKQKELFRKLQSYLEKKGSGPLGLLFRGPLFNGIEKTLSAEKNGTGFQVSGLLQSLDGYSKQFYEDVEEYKLKYGAKFFPEDTIARGAVNVMTMRLWADLSGIPMKEREAMNALALLHPVTDEVIDSGTFDPKTLQKITDLLAGKPQTAQTPYETLVFDFIGKMYARFPNTDHKIFDDAISSLHQLQIMSAKQKPGMPTKELLDLTFKKGGLSTVAAGYVALGGLTPAQHEFFFKAGAVFQIMDDLADIKGDLKDGISTVWTNELRTKGNIDEPMRRFLATEAAFERDLPRLAADFNPKANLAGIYPEAYRITLAKGLLRNDDPAIASAWRLVDQYYPVRPQTLAQIAESTKAISPMIEKCSSSFARLLKNFDAY
jgi:hypothetical protein